MKVPSQFADVKTNPFEFYPDGNGGMVAVPVDPRRNRLAEDKVARAYGGKEMHGDQADYVDFGQLDPNRPGHGGDQGKLPYHTTFSNQSAFAAGDGSDPHWDMNGYQGSTEDVYHPTPEQLQQKGYPSRLQRYLEAERGHGIDRVQMPAPYREDAFNIK